MDGGGGTIHVLHVDDEPDFANLVATVLERADDRLEVRTANSAAEGLDVLAADDVDCIVSDYDMPGRNGIEFLETVREDHADLPFVLFTGKGSEALASRAISSGVTEYLQKGSGTSQYELLANRIRDVLAQVRARRKRERQEDRLRTFVEQSTDIVSVLKPDGTFQYLSPSVKPVLGYEPEAMIGENAFEYVHPDDRAEVRATFEQAVADPNATPAAEFRFRDAEDSWRWLESRGNNQLENPAVDGFVINSRDITERKERERKLERYETIVEVSGDPMYMLDDDGRFTYVNDAHVETTGYSESALLGEHVTKVLDEEDVARGEDVIRSLLGSDERVETIEMTLHTARGEQIPTENHISLRYDDGEFHGTIGVLRNISERVDRERQLERERNKFAQFASVVSHDLRNPLNVATSRLTLAREEVESEHLSHIEHALARMDTLIEDLLSLARVGETVGETDAVELAALLESCWQHVETASAQLNAETETTIRADASRLRQLLENLLRNAIDHGGGEVTITVGDLPEGFSVEDDGPGIPEEERGRVLDPGYSTAADGTGFGLSIVREIAEAHGWDIDVTDSSDGGARFEFTGVHCEE